jgi:hypothetical protein
MNVFRALLSLPAAIVLTLATPAPVLPQTADDQEMNIRSYIELIRSDLKTNKMAVTAKVMQLNEADGAKFWPIYREYDAELTKLGDARLAMIREYTERYEQLTDKDAHSLALQALDLESKRTHLKRKYYQKFESALSARTAARFFQVENQLLMLIDLQVASILPVVK